MPSKNRIKLKPRYIHTNVEIKQSPKKHGNECGDVVEVYRDAISTNIILCDGIGSGLVAHIYATMCCSRIVEMLREGISLKKTFDSVGDTMNKAWGKNKPFSVFTIARILDNGNTTVMAYDMPPPIFVCKQYAEIANSRVYYWEKAKISESHFQINQHEGVLLMSDGITQSGLGNGLVNGWETEGVVRFVNHLKIDDQHYFSELVKEIHQRALLYWGKKYGDDCTVVSAHNRRGITLNVLTGTPEDRENDSGFVNEYMESEGIKVVCGGSTSRMLARELKKPIEIIEEELSVTPPTYRIPGITLATEGMITLNQLYNLLNEDISYSDDHSIIVELVEYFDTADKVLFWVGKASNIGNDLLELKQQGIQNRLKIVKLISEKLIQMNKLVIVKSR